MEQLENNSGSTAGRGQDSSDAGAFFFFSPSQPRPHTSCPFKAKIIEAQDLRRLSSPAEGAPHSKSQPGEESSLTSGGSITSETSSVWLRPVPRKRTFLSRQASNVSEFSGRVTPGGSVTGGPAHRRSTQPGSSLSSGQSNRGETARLASWPLRQELTQADSSQQPVPEPHQAPSGSSSERDQRPAPSARDR